jgi:serine protease Do
MNVTTCFRTLMVFVTLSFVSTASGAAGLPDFRKIVRDSSPAVVKIIVEQKAVEVAQGQPDEQQIPEYLRRFFEGREGPQAPRQRMGTGSGFIVSRDGYIITNNHVVENADSVLVRMSDRQEFDAEVIGTDPRSDLALLRIKASALPGLFSHCRYCQRQRS